MRKLLRPIAVVYIVTFIFFMPVSYAYGMSIFVEKQWDSSIVQIEVDAADTVESLKGKIQDKTDIPPDQQILSYGGERLEDGGVLQSYGITEGSTILLSLLVSPNINITPAAINFGNTIIGERSFSVLEFAFVESTPGAINIIGNNGVFAVHSSNLDSVTGSVKISFTPTGTGTYSDTLILTDDSGDLIKEVRLSGIGVAGNENQPENNNGHNDAQNKPAEQNSQTGINPKTGDSVNIAMLVGLFVFCMALSIFAIKRKKKNY